MGKVDIISDLKSKISDLKKELADLPAGKRKKTQKLRNLEKRARKAYKRKKTETRHHIVHNSGNIKTGSISVSRSTSNTCPPSCPLLVSGNCYDLSGNGGIHRRIVDNDGISYFADTGEIKSVYETLSIEEYIRKIPTFSDIYRHCEGGDLWNGYTVEHISRPILKKFATANKRAKKRAIVYTHKPTVGKRSTEKVRAHNRKAILESGAHTAINVSCDNLAEVDECFEHGLDSTVILPLGSEKITITPNGEKVVLCPALYSDTQCGGNIKPCGKGKPLCTLKNRKFAVGFIAHGSSKKQLSKFLTIIQK